MKDFYAELDFRGTSQNHGSSTYNNRGQNASDLRTYPRTHKVDNGTFALKHKYTICNKKLFHLVIRKAEKEFLY